MKDNKYRVTSFRDEIFIDEKNIEEVIYRLNTKYEMMNELYENSEEEIERLNKIINKTRRHLEILLEMALEQDSENVNLIDRLKGILDILGSDKE